MDPLERLQTYAEIYNNIIGRERYSTDGLNLLDTLEELMNDAVVEIHKATYPDRYETTTEETE